MTLDHLGTVGEVRALGVPILGAVPSGTPADEQAFRAGLLALVESAKDAVGQWLYDPPADAPIAVTNAPQGISASVTESGQSLSVA